MCPVSSPRTEHLENPVLLCAADVPAIPSPMALSLVVTPCRQQAASWEVAPPLVLHVYGAYGLPEDVSYRPDHRALIDRGVVVAVAHVRGGSYKGPAWYEGGRGLRKEAGWQVCVYVCVCARVCFRVLCVLGGGAGRGRGAQAGVQAGGRAGG